MNLLAHITTYDGYALACVYLLGILSGVALSSFAAMIWQRRSR